MDKYCNSKMAIKELEEKNGFEILPEPDEEQEYRKILSKYEQTKSDFLKKLEEAGYSEFMKGIMLGMTIATETKKTREHRWMPSFLKKD